jgi:hypothetical protein
MKDSRACPRSSNQRDFKEPPGSGGTANEHRFIKPWCSCHNLIKGVGRVLAAGQAAGW